MKRTITIIIVLCVTQTIWSQESVVSLCGTQESSNGRYNLGQVFAPDAAALSVAEDIPVDPHTGRATVTIPLAELRVTGYTLPVSLKYLTGGIRVTDHPGWIGEGWSLQAGGCINRIINGHKDEESFEEGQFKNYINPSYYNVAYGSKVFPLQAPGYYYHMDLAQNQDWSNTDRLDSLFYYPGQLDLAPDEFVVCMDDVQGSFFFSPEGIKVFPKNGCSRFRVEYEFEDEGSSIPFWSKGAYSLTAYRFHYFKTFTVVSDKGIRYKFGGSDSSIDFSYEQCLKGTGQRLVGCANTWYLTEILFPGGEQIVFTYEKDGYPVVVHDVHSRLYAVKQDINQPGVLTPQMAGYYTAEIDTCAFSNLSYTFLHPSYLTSIHSAKRGEAILFNRIRSSALGYNAESYKMSMQLGTMCSNPNSPFSFSSYLTDDYYCRLSNIETPRGIIYFEQREQRYRQQRSMDLGDGFVPTRLRLLNLFMTANNGEADWRYSFQYEGDYPLPSYNSKLTDHWGYFNSRYYGDLLSRVLGPYQYHDPMMNDKFYNKTFDEEMGERRAPNPEYMMIGALKTIKYPTGGVTKLVYEPHTYSQVVRMRPRRLLQREGIAGGLRIKEIIDSTSDGVLRRHFLYHNSGILSQRPRYGAIGLMGGTTNNEGMHVDINNHEPLEPKSFLDYTGNNTLTYISSWEDDVEDLRDTLFVGKRIRMCSEQSLRQIPVGKESHVNYSHVTEVLPNGSSITYDFTDFSTYPDADPEYIYETVYNSSYLMPSTSYSHCRGLLIKKERKDSLGRMITREEYAYDSVNPSKTLYAITKRVFHYVSSMIGIYVNRIYWEGLKMTERKETTWDDNGCAVVRVEQYDYDDDCRIVKRRITDSTSVVSDFYHYSESIPVGVYQEMSAGKGMTGVLIEHVKSENGEISSAELTTWRRHESCDNNYVPSAVYKCHFTESFDSLFRFNGVSLPLEYGVAEVTYQKYDSDLNPVQVIIKSDRPETFTWDSHGRQRGRFWGARRDSTDRVWKEAFDSLNIINLSEKNSPQYNIPVHSDTTGSLTITLSCLDASPRSIWGRIGNDTDSLLFFHCPASELSGGRYWTHTFPIIPAGWHNVRLTTDPDDWLPIDVAGGVFTGLFPAPSDPVINPIVNPDEPPEPFDPGEPGPYNPGTQIQNPDGIPLWGEIGIKYSILRDVHHPRNEGEVVHLGFESDGDYTSEGFHSSRAQVDSLNLTVILNLDKLYYIDKQVLRNGHWEYERSTLTPNREGHYTISAGGLPFDEVRIYPVDAEVETYTWWPDGNLRSRTDGRGVTESYVYDAFGRLIEVRDTDGNRMEGYDYHYATHLDMVGL